MAKSGTTQTPRHEVEPVGACHHMERALERMAEGTAGPLTRAAVNVHTLSCAACRMRLTGLREAAAKVGGDC